MQIKIKPNVYIHKQQLGLAESVDLSWVAGLLRGVQDGRSLQSAAESWICPIGLYGIV